MQLNAYLTFHGRCEEAFEFYERALGGKILMRSTYKDSPMGAGMPPEAAAKIIHIRMQVGDQVLMGSDDMQGGMQGAPEPARGFTLNLNTTGIEESERLFTALSEDAEIKMPLQQTFWAVRFGMLVDRFGIPWMVNCEPPSA